MRIHNPDPQSFFSLQHFALGVDLDPDMDIESIKKTSHVFLFTFLKF